MRDLMAFGAVLIFLPLGLGNTFVAYILWGWTGLISLNSYLYGFMVSIPLAQIFALITLAKLLGPKDPKAQKFEPTRTTVLMIVFTFHALLCALFAYPGVARNWDLFSNLAKTILFCLLMPILVTNRFRIHALLIALVMALTYHGVLDGLRFIASGGGHHATGISKFGDNNHFALVLLMVIPLQYFLFQYSSRRLVRWGFASAVLLTVFAVVATNSRGALVGLIAIALWIVLRGRRKILGLLAIGIIATAVVMLASESWTERMNSMQSAEDDSSFMSRVSSWKIASAMALENPVFGGGLRALQSPVWFQFQSAQGILGFVETPPAHPGLAAHSIWFEVMGDMGFVGLSIFIILLVNTFITRREIRALVKKGGEQYRWATDLADLLAAAMLAYMVSGSLLSAAYFESPYIWMMLMEVIKQVIISNLKSPKPGTVLPASVIHSTSKQVPALSPLKQKASQRVVNSAADAK